MTSGVITDMKSLLIRRIQIVSEYSAAVVFGGVMYGAIETLARGYTHPSMLVTGGICFAGLYAIEKHSRRGLLIRVIMGALLITAAEFISGCICNLWLRWDVWDYSHLHLNLLGQICLRFTILWALLCIPAYRLAAILRGAFGYVEDQSSSSASDSPSSLL